MTGNRRWIHYLKLLFLGAVLSFAWGVFSTVLHLDRYFSDEALRSLFSISFPEQIVLYGFVSPVVEEVLFRQLLYTLLKKVLPSRTSAIIASAVFALWHGNVIQALYAFPMGLLFQYLLDRDKTLISPVCCHCGANLAAVFAQAAFFGG